MKFSLFFLFAMVASALGATIPSIPSTVYQPCPSGYYALTQNADLHTPANFNPNVVIYDAGSNMDEIMAGTPQTPYVQFLDGPDCYWAPNATFNCGINVYTDAAHTELLGAGSVTGSNFNYYPGDASPYVGGYLTLSYNINKTFTGSILGNTQNLALGQHTVQVYYQPENVYTANGTVMENRVIAYNNAANTGYDLILSLWGSNGYNAATDMFVNPTVGFDIRLSLTCLASPPVIRGTCPACASGNVVLASSCYSSHQAVSQTVSGNCLSLSFSSASSNTLCSTNNID